MSEHMTMDLGPQVEEAIKNADRQSKDKLLELLDRVEAEVEDLRCETMKLEDRKDGIFTALDSLRNSDMLKDLDETDRDDIERYVERISSRCLTVEILVKTVRDKEQEEALYQVNRLIDSLVVSFKSDPELSRCRCESYIAACSPAPEIQIDKIFEDALLGCTLDDQKKIKKRLIGLYNYISRENSQPCQVE